MNLDTLRALVAERRMRPLPFQIANEGLYEAGDGSAHVIAWFDEPDGYEPPYILAACNALPTLLDEIDRLHAEVKRLRSEASAVIGGEAFNDEQLAALVAEFRRRGEECDERSERRGLTLVAMTAYRSARNAWFKAAERLAALSAPSSTEASVPSTREEIMARHHYVASLVFPSGSEMSTVLNRQPKGAESPRAALETLVTDLEDGERGWEWLEGKMVEHGAHVKIEVIDRETADRRG